MTDDRIVNEITVVQRQLELVRGHAESIDRAATLLFRTVRDFFWLVLIGAIAAIVAGGSMAYAGECMPTKEGVVLDFEHDTQFEAPVVIDASGGHYLVRMLYTVPGNWGERYQLRDGDGNVLLQTMTLDSFSSGVYRSARIDRLDPTRFAYTVQFVDGGHQSSYWLVIHDADGDAWQLLDGPGNVIDFAGSRILVGGYGPTVLEYTDPCAEPNAAARADLNGDGIVDGADVGIMLGLWGAVIGGGA